MPTASTSQTVGDTLGPAQRHKTGLITILFTDLVGSTALKQQVGDRTGASLIQQHHALVRELLRGSEGGEEIETAGDSFLLVFAKPSDAVRFGLLLHARLRSLNQRLAAKLEDRIGIHVGEVVIREENGSPNAKGLIGSQVDACARVMSLAQGGQILLTRAAFDSARQMLRGEDVAGIGPLEWLNHGSYVLKGIESALEVCEVGEVGIAPFRAPVNTDKAQRQTTAERQLVLGWRPALGQFVPNSRWQLEAKLGEGGFGEVWLGRNPTTKERRVFKFCFEAERVRYLKRELTLFRVLKERVGEHPHITRLHDVYLDHPPFYVEMDYVEGADLLSWCKAHGGIEAIPFETRLEIVAQAAEGLKAAHEAGIIHRDIKPANMLVGGAGVGPSDVRVKLTDFGIGQVVSDEILKGITRAGFTETILSDSSSGTGTHLYMAPELLAGQAASIRSDIYSLGVILYQLLTGSFTRPVTTDWAKRIADPLLREDLECCFAGDPVERFPSAELLASHLRTLAERREALRKREAEMVARERVAYRRGMALTAGVGAVILGLIGALAVVAFNQSKRATAAAAAEKEQRIRVEFERQRGEHGLYAMSVNLAQAAWELNNAGRLRQVLAQTAANQERGFEWYYWQRQAHLATRTFRVPGSWLTFDPDDRGFSSDPRAATNIGWWSAAAIAFSPDGQRLVSTRGDATAQVWNMATGKEMFSLKGHYGKITLLAYSPDNRWIITAADDESERATNRLAILWDATTGEKRGTFYADGGQFRAVAFSPDSRRIVAGCAYSWSNISNNTVIVWDLSTGQRLLNLRGHADAILAVGFSSDGRRIITGSTDRTAKVWDAGNGEKLFDLSTHSAPVSAAAFFPNNTRIVTGCTDGTVLIWDSINGKELFALTGHSARVNAVAFSADGQRLVTSGADQTVRVWDTAHGRELLILKGQDAVNGAAAFSPDGQWVFTSGSDGTVGVWDAAKGTETLTLRGHNAWIRAVAFSPDSQRVITGSGDWPARDNTAAIWEVAEGKRLLTLPKHGSFGVTSVAFSPDGKRVLTGCDDDTAKVWDAASGALLLTLLGHGSGIWSVAFSPDGQQIAAGCQNGTAKLWDARTGQERFTLAWHKYRIVCLTFSPDSRRIATGSDQLKVWDAASGQPVLELEPHGGGIGGTAFSPDGRWIVTGSPDHMARLWDAASGQKILTLQGHSDGIEAVAFSPDGKRIVTGSADRTAKVWSATSGLDLLTLRGHTAGIRSVAFSPDGLRIVTGSFDHTAKVWQAATPTEVAAWEKADHDESSGRAAPP